MRNKGLSPTYLDPRDQVRFQTTDHPRDYIDVRLSWDGDEVELMASGPMVLFPQVTNVVRVRLA
jgi:hypothetical protein